MLLAPEDVFAKDLPSLEAPAVGWQAFSDLEFIGEMVVVLALAISLAAVIAYHPTLRGRASTLEEIEQPKTFIMYSMVGALIAIIVKVQPSMALVVFGIGGLMRFRTDVGQAKDTGRVILVTVIGLCCGLELYVVAVLGAVLGWLLIFALEGRKVEALVIQGLEKDAVQRASDAHITMLRELGCTILGEEKRVKKGCVVILYRPPRRLERAHVERRIAELPEADRGTVSWES